MSADRTSHIGYEKGDRAGKKASYHRNGSSKKTLIGEDGHVEIEAPREHPRDKRELQQSVLLNHQYCKPKNRAMEPLHGLYYAMERIDGERSPINQHPEKIMIFGWLRQSA